jgi:anaerobic ribonucleoside-triphosphate reductase
MIVKRDGTKVPFDKTKIINAINAAFIEVDGVLYETDTAIDIADEIELYVNNFHNRNFNATNIEEAWKEINRLISVEDIQNLVEEYLMRSERRDVARAYIRYRYKKEVARNY